VVKQSKYLELLNSSWFFGGRWKMHQSSSPQTMTIPPRRLWSALQLSLLGCSKMLTQVNASGWRLKVSYAIVQLVLDNISASKSAHRITGIGLGLRSVLDLARSQRRRAISSQVHIKFTLSSHQSSPQ
jgi:hypothetical protein